MLQVLILIQFPPLQLAIVNPLPVKRFMQMRLQRIKTDKSDAKMLSAYGESEQPKEWIPDSEYMQLG
jgi:transposase